MSDRSFEWTLTVVPSDGESVERNGTAGTLESLSMAVSNATADIVEDVDQAMLDADSGDDTAAEA